MDRSRRKTVKPKLSSERGSESKSKRIKAMSFGKSYENGKLLMNCHGTFVRFDISNCEDPDPSALENLPLSSIHYERGHIGASCFEHNNQIFLVGGMDFNEADYVYPLEVYKIESNSSSSGQPRFNLSIAKTFGRLNGPKPRSFTMTIGRKVYILSGWLSREGHSDFEVLDLDSPCLSWKVLPRPSSLLEYESDKYALKVLEGYAVGSRLFFLLTDHEWDSKRLWYFDTDIELWFDAYPSIKCPFPRTSLASDLYAKTFVVSGLKHLVLLSYYFPVQKVRPRKRRLFATLVTSSGYPLCYQEISDSIFQDLFPPYAYNNSAAVFDVGGGVNCAAMVTRWPSDVHISLCFFRLSATREGLLFDSLHEDQLVSDHLLHEFRFLDVHVCDKYISRLDAVLPRITDAHFL